MPQPSNLQQRDLATLVHPYTNLDALRATGPTVIERGEGVYVWDSEGKRYIEGMAGLWCTALGYGNRELAETAREQLSKLSFAHLFSGKSHDPAIALAEKLKEIVPAPAARIFFTSSGSEANDTQIKLVWYYNNARGKPQKKKIISRERAYHGVTIASASLTGLPANHADFDLPMAGVLHAGCPHYYRYAQPGESEEAFATRLAEELDALIQREDPDTIAAFIAEPVMGAGGVIVPPATYFDKVQKVLRQYDILFIVDEVICGFGRTGNPFGSDTFALAPDTISVAKAITSAYAPLGALTIHPAVWEAMLAESRKLGTFAHGYTYSGHPLATALGLKTLEIYERDNVFWHVRDVAPLFQRRLKALGEHPLVGEARGVGLIGGIELVADKAKRTPFDPKRGVGAQAAACVQNEGVILRAIGDTLAICPPLIIEEDAIDAMFDAIERGLDAMAMQLAKAA